MVRMTKQLKKRVDELTADAQLWESRKLGASAKHARPVSSKEARAVDDALGLHLLSFRIDKSVIEKFKKLSKLEGIGYQPLMRQVLTRYAHENTHRLKNDKRAKSA